MKHKYANGRGTPFSIPILRSNYLSIYNRKSGLVTLLICLFSFHFVCFAQESRESGVTGIGEIRPLMVGQKVPEEFWTKEHLFYINGDTVRRTLEEHRGKTILLSFWSTGCSRCFLNQKDITFYKEKYADDLVVVMVNSKQSRDDYDRINNFYDSDRFSRLKLNNLISVIEDEYLEVLFSHIGYPSYFWINKWENLQTMTYRNFLDTNYTLPYIDK